MPSRRLGVSIFSIEVCAGVQKRTAFHANKIEAGRELGLTEDGELRHEMAAVVGMMVTIVEL